MMKLKTSAAAAAAEEEEDNKEDDHHLVASAASFLPSSLSLSSSSEAHASLQCVAEGGFGFLILQPPLSARITGMGDHT